MTENYYLPQMPTEKEVAKILAFNKKMLGELHSLLEQAITEDQLLLNKFKAAINSKKGNFDDYEYSALFIFRSARTNQMLLTVGWWFPQFSAIQSNIDEFHEALNKLFPLNFDSNKELKAWLSYLFKEFKVQWQEILNVGKVEISYSIKNEFWDYNQGKPLVELA